MDRNQHKIPSLIHYCASPDKIKAYKEDRDNIFNEDRIDEESDF